MARCCSSCPYSTYGLYNPLSDVCDGCQSDPETGWYGHTDHSIEDEDGNPCYYTNEDEHHEFLELYDWNEW